MASACFERAGFGLYGAIGSVVSGRDLDFKAVQRQCTVIQFGPGEKNPRIL